VEVSPSAISLYPNSKNISIQLYSINIEYRSRSDNQIGAAID
jgi:hypothetical protein